MRITYDKIDILNPPKTNNRIGVCITTNGIVKRDGLAVMGAGIAKQAVNQYGINVAKTLGHKLDLAGNHAYHLGCQFSKNDIEFDMFSFPTKNHWKDDSSLELIAQSAREMVVFANSLHLNEIYLPTVGCGCGNLNIKHVLEVCSDLLDDRFIMVLPEKFKNELAGFNHTLSEVETTVVDSTILSVIESCIRTINTEFERCYWNANQQEIDGFIHNGGESIKTDVFEARPYIWDEDSPEYGRPNFRYDNLYYDWYKHLGRGDYAVLINKDEISVEFLSTMINRCCYSIRKHFNQLYPSEK